MRGILRKRIKAGMPIYTLFAPPHRNNFRNRADTGITNADRSDTNPALMLCNFAKIGNAGPSLGTAMRTGPSWRWPPSPARFDDRRAPALTLLSPVPNGSSASSFPAMPSPASRSVDVTLCPWLYMWLFAVLWSAWRSLCSSEMTEEGFSRALSAFSTTSSGTNMSIGHHGGHTEHTLNADITVNLAERRWWRPSAHT